MSFSQLRMLVIAAVAFSLVGGCKKNSSPTDAGTPTDTTKSITKSPKRGLAFDLTDPADLAVLAPGVSWWYNWGTSTQAPAGYNAAYQMEFIPMVWGGSPSTQTQTNVKTFILAHPEVKYLLVLNEPNLTDQANRTPAQAASDWLAYEKIASDLAAQGRTIYLVGPAMNWGTMSGYSDPVTWLDAFFTAYWSANSGRDPKIDYLAFHWYDYGLAAQLDRLQKYGRKIWITEMANWNSAINSYAKQEAQMQDMVNTCETRTDVFRYAWFYGRGTPPDSRYTNLLGQNPGVLTELGVKYLSLPYTK